MAQYTDANGQSNEGRYYIVSAPEIHVIASDGSEVKVLLETDAPGPGPSDNIEKVTTAVDYVPEISAVKENSALVVQNTTMSPVGTPSEAVIPTVFVSTVVGSPTEPSSGNQGPGHVIGVFNELMIEEDTETAFGIEQRVDPRSGVLDQFVAVKYVIGPDSQNGGTIGSFVLEQLDNMEVDVTNVGGFERNYLDRRLVTTNLGGVVRGTEQITANRTLTKRDSGKHFMVIAGSAVTVTFGPDVTDGCTFHFVQGGAGAINFAVSPDKAWYAKSNQTSTNGQLAECSVRVYPFGATVGTFVSST